MKRQRRNTNRNKSRALLARERIERQHRQFEIVRLLLTTDRSARDIAQDVMSKTTVGKLKRRLEELGLQWAGQVEHMHPDMLDEQLHGKVRVRRKKTVMPDLAAIAAEVDRGVVTVRQAWKEYAEKNPGRAMSYSRLSALLAQHRKNHSPVMRQVYNPGDSVQVDFSGKTMEYIDAETRKVVTAQIFIAVCAYSKLLFVCAVPSQTVKHFLSACVQALNFFGAAPREFVFDNLKSAVLKARPEPVFQRDTLEFSRVYNMALRPARPLHPRDKAVVENHVNVFRRVVKMPLRHESFYSLEALNAALMEKTEALNHHTMKACGESRWTRYNQRERAMMQSLPAQPYEYARFVDATVPRDYHILVDGHAYSVPHRLIGEAVSARVTERHVEIFMRGTSIALHAIGERGEHTTVRSHQPPNHQAQADRNPEGMRQWARSVGPHTLACVEHAFSKVTNPSMALPICESLQALARKHGTKGLEKASAEARRLRSMCISTIKRELADPRRPGRVMPTTTRHQQGLSSPPTWRGDARWSSHNNAPYRGQPSPGGEPCQH